MTVSVLGQGRTSAALFWLGVVAISLGVAFHLPDFIAAKPMGYRMAGMPMSPLMLWGMALILVGLPCAAVGLLPRSRADSAAGSLRPVVVWRADSALTPRHWILIAVLSLAMVIDIMKPSLLGFVVPGVGREYGLAKPTLTLLPLVALTGTAVGSLLWGLIADLIGRRAAILLAAIIFIGTSICGAMPSFAWNLAMCFIMGLGAGGMLPVALTLIAETVPPAHRGWLLVLLGGVGAFGGYLAASGSAALLEPHFGWRILWFTGMPTGVLLIVLNRLIPESPGYLVLSNRLAEAAATAQRFGGALALEAQAATAPKRRQRESGRLLPSVAMTFAGVVSGLVNYGFILWLPAEMRKAGASAGATDGLLLAASLLTLPTAVLAAWAYRKFGGRVLLFVLLATLAAGFAALGLSGPWSPGGDLRFIAVVSIVMIGNGGAAAVLLPYAIEYYPLAMRGRGAGLVAGGTKGGGIAAQALSIGGLAPTSAALAVPAAAAALAILSIAHRQPGARGDHAMVGSAPPFESA